MLRAQREHCWWHILRSHYETVRHSRLHRDYTKAQRTLRSYQKWKLKQPAHVQISVLDHVDFYFVPICASTHLKRVYSCPSITQETLLVYLLILQYPNTSL